MASTKINTVQILDSRIDPQPSPTYAVTIGPDQNQWYSLEASGLTNSSINFNNFTTLGPDRAYLDSFELGLEVEVSFTSDVTPHDEGTSESHTSYYGYANESLLPGAGKFMFQSFPFNTVCDQVQVNINGGAFFSNPSQIIRAKERYWKDMYLQSSYANVCPCCKPYAQTESGSADIFRSEDFLAGVFKFSKSRMLGLQGGNAYSSVGPSGSTNYSAMPQYNPEFLHKTSPPEGMTGDYKVTRKLTLSWREPIMCAPFSSRYDATYGRPLYNITSMDIQFKMLSNLKNMFLLFAPTCLESWEVNITKAFLFYQVLTVSAPIPHDITIVPYRRYVPFITNGTGTSAETAVHGTAHDIILKSTVYSLNEVPTAIWIFAAPTLQFLQEVQTLKQIPNEGRFFGDTTQVTNKLFGFMKKVSISCGNTTQILDTAKPEDLYRIAKANGCEDSYEDWAIADPREHAIIPAVTEVPIPGQANPTKIIQWGEQILPILNNHGYHDISSGCGSVLRLIPGVDIVLPEQPLIPGANANNLVFQVEAKFDFQFGGGNAQTGLNSGKVPLALWILFEYVGVATFTPGNCMVTMNPLGNGAVMQTAPVVSGRQMEEISKLEGSGWFDKFKEIMTQVNDAAKESKVLSKILPHVHPKVGPILASIAQNLGYGDHEMGEDDDDESMSPPKGTKRARGGAVMGLGDFC